MVEDIEKQCIIEYCYRATDGEFWIDVWVDRELYAILGPFATATERQRAHDDLMATMRSQGARDLPVFRQ